MTKTFYYYSNPSTRRKNWLSFAGIYDTETNSICIGVAQCNRKDTFIKKFGRHIAEERAIKKPCAKVSIPENFKRGECFVSACKALAELPTYELFHNTQQ